MKIETLKPIAVQPRSLLLSLERDIDSWLPNLYNHRDIEYLCKRIDNEGFKPFITKMAQLGKEIEKAVIAGSALSVPHGWPIHSNSRLPRCFYHIFKYVFQDNGLIYRHTKGDIAFKMLRQIFLMWSKYDDGEMVESKNAISDFHQRISRTRHTYPLNQEIQPGLTTVMCVSEARRLLATIFRYDSSLCQPLRDFEKNPWGRHGPGAVAGRESAADKWNVKIFPHLPNQLFRFNKRDDRYFFRRNSIPSARVTCVPKDFRGPRIICIEPKENQFAQQGLMTILMELTRRSSLLKKSISFTDVSASRHLCFDNRFATIDMKDASDNISLGLIKLLYPRWMYKLLVRYRTPILDGIRSGCFATMGSAICFPIQTITFWALTQSVINLMSRHYRFALTKCRVFGDDIIAPTRYAFSICNVLTACGLKVNTQKTCVLTPARESCGEWVYANRSVRNLKVKNHNVSSYSDWLGLIDRAKEAYLLGLYALSNTLRNLAYEFYSPITRWSKTLHKLEVRVPYLTGRRQKLDGWAGIYTWHIGGNLNPFNENNNKIIKWTWADYNSFIAGLEDETVTLNGVV